MVRIVQFIERRRSTRKPATGSAWALANTDHDGPALASMHLEDVSDTGLAAISPVAWPLAEPLTVLLPGDSARGFGGICAGRVVRCDRAGGKFRVAVAFNEHATAG